MDHVILYRALACLDTMTPRHGSQIARVVWPDRQFSTEQAAGATIRPVLGELAQRKLARRTPQGWIRLEVLDDK